MPSYMYERDESSYIEVTDVSADDKPKVLLKKDSLGSAKQISVDPISLREPSKPNQSSKVDLMISLTSSKNNKFLIPSLPNSPCFGSHLTKKKKKKAKTRSQLPSSVSVLQRQDSVALSNLERLRELHLQRSKSCGEGRTSAPPQVFDHWISKDDSLIKDEKYSSKEINSNYYKNESKIAKPHGKENIDAYDEKFKCRALCLHLPSFGKAKVVKATRQGSNMSQLQQATSAAPKITTMGHVVSKRVSLEKFDCVNDNEDDYDDEGDASDGFFDLPLEMISCCINDDTDAPVTTAFVFDKEPKGVLKNCITSASAKSSTHQRKSTESVRHVRFSVSSRPASPTACETPRLYSARDDFNAFLEAQMA